MSLLRNLLIGLAAGQVHTRRGRFDRSEKSGGFFGIVHYRYLGKGRVLDGLNNPFKPAGHVAAIGNFAALVANPGRHVFNDDNTLAGIGRKCGKTVPRFTFAHKTDHFVLSRRVLKSADHSSGFGKYAVISHNSVPLEPQTTCKGLFSGVNPKV
jgi:hypothetical protein